MTDQNELGPIDWSLTTWKGSRRKQHQEFHALSFSRKMEIIEEMNDFTRQWQHSLRKNRRQPESGQSSIVREQPDSE